MAIQHFSPVFSGFKYAIILELKSFIGVDIAGSITYRLSAYTIFDCKRAVCAWIDLCDPAYHMKWLFTFYNVVDLNFTRWYGGQR
jgi:hypothetical protein